MQIFEMGERFKAWSNGLNYFRYSDLTGIIFLQIVCEFKMVNFIDGFRIITSLGIVIAAMGIIYVITEKG